MTEIALPPEDPNVSLSIVIVGYRTCEDVRNCLESLLRTGGLNGVENPQIVLVDNASGDGTSAMCRTLFPEVLCIESPENVGFSRANNLGLVHCTGHHILLLNPDTIVPEGQLKLCVSWLQQQGSKVAAMTCRVESQDGSLQLECSRRLITPWSECCRALLLNRMFTRSDLFNRELLVRWDRSDSRPVGALLGAFMLIRRSALQAIGGLDGRFFLMYEDVDWCRRAADSGYTLWFWPGARIVHLGGTSWKQVPIATYANQHVSALAYFRKHHPRSVGVVRAVSQIGMELKIAALRLNALRRPGDAYTSSHLKMALAARTALRTEQPIVRMLPANTPATHQTSVS